MIFDDVVAFWPFLCEYPCWFFLSMTRDLQLSYDLTHNDPNDANSSFHFANWSISIQFDLLNYSRNILYYYSLVKCVHLAKYHYQYNSISLRKKANEYMFTFEFFMYLYYILWYNVAFSAYSFTFTRYTHILTYIYIGHK